MLLTQRVTLLFLVCKEEFRGQLVELLPQRLFAAIVELSAEAIVAQQFSEMLLVMLWYLQQSDSGRHTAWQSTRLNKQ